MSVETCYRVTLKCDACRTTIETEDHAAEPRQSELDRKRQGYSVMVDVPGSGGRVRLCLQAVRGGPVDGTKAAPADICQSCAREAVAAAWRALVPGAGRYETPGTVEAAVEAPPP